MRTDLAATLVAAGSIALLSVLVLLTTGTLPHDHSPGFALAVVVAGFALGRWTRTHLTADRH